MPESRRTTPAIIELRVDLPAPFSPTRATTSPAGTVKLTDLSTCTPAYDLTRSWQTNARSETLARFSSFIVNRSWSSRDDPVGYLTFGP